MQERSGYRAELVPGERGLKSPIEVRVAAVGPVNQMAKLEREVRGEKHEEEKARDYGRSDEQNCPESASNTLERRCSARSGPCRCGGRIQTR